VSSQTEIRQHVTNQIVESLTNGDLPPWRQPWNNDPNAPGLFTSLSTGQSYRGINQLILQASASRQNLKSKWWGTYNQIQKCGANVRRGQKGTKIVLWKPVSRKQADKNGDEVDDRYLKVREFSVFNAAQTTGLKQFRVGFAQPEQDTIDRHKQGDEVIEATNADIRYGGNEAFYSPQSDFIQCPFRHQFNPSDGFYETMFHELCHWSEQRVGFDRSQTENTFALGELIAEIGSCFMMGELGLPMAESLDNHATYVKGWLKEMNNDPKFIFKAASQATKTVDFILSFTRSSAPVVEPTVDLPF